MSIPRGNRTCITHGERRPISCLDAFGPRPCKYKCKRHHPCDAGKLPQSLKRRPSKLWKRGVLQPLDAVVAAVDTEDDSDAELALQIEKILADPVGSSGEQLHASASSGEQFRWPYPGTPGAEDTTPYGEQQCPTTMMQPAGSQDKRPRCGTCSKRHARDLPLRRMLAYFVPRMRAAMPRMRKRLLPRLSRHAQVRDPMVDRLDADAPW